MKLSSSLSAVLLTSIFIIGCGDNNTTSLPEKQISNPNVAVNNAPVASNSLLPLSADTTGSFTLTAADADNDPITYKQISQPEHGTITKFDTDNGTFTYVPEDGFTGQDKFTYNASDGVSSCPAKTVTIDVKQQMIPLPNKTTNLKVTSTPSYGCAVKLTWQDNSDNEDGFEIYKNGKLYCVKAADETSAIIDDLDVDTVYSFEVRAKNASGSSSSSEYVIRTVAEQVKPNAPTDLKVTKKSDTIVRLAWEDNADNESGYEIYKNGELLKTISPNCACTMIGGLAPETSYTFEVKAKNSTGRSAAASVTVTTEPEINTPPLTTPAENKAPEVTTDSNKVITLGDTVTITATASDSDGSITKYAWAEGDKVLSDKKTFDYTPTTVGEHFLIITVNDDDHATASAPVKVVVKEKVEPVKPNQAPTANAGEDKSVEEKKEVVLTGSGEDSDGTIASYKWEEAGVILGTSAKLSYTPKISGKHTLTLTVTDDKGLSASDAVVVTATPIPDTVKPVIILKGSAKVTITQASVYKDAGATASDDKDGDITSKIVKTGSVDTNTAGTYTIKYNVKDAANNSASEVTRTVIVSEVPNQAPTANAGADRSVQQGKSITLTGSGTDPEGKALTYRWSKGDETLGDKATLVYKGVVLGTDRITLTVTDDKGLTATDTAVITTTEKVNAKPVINSFTLDKAVYTVGDTVTYNYQIDDDDGVLNVRVLLGTKEVDGAMPLTPSTRTGSFKVSQAGNLQVTLKIQDNSSTVTKSINIVVKEAVVNKAPTVSAGVDKSIEVNKSTTLVSTATDPEGKALTYKWTEGSTILGTSANLPYTPTTVGTHTITLTVTDDKGLTATDSAVITATEVPDTQKPVITRIGNASITITVGDNYIDAGATATDNKDGDITDDIVKTGSVDTNTVGTYIIKYNVKDAANNSATEVTRTVVVKAAEIVDPYADYVTAKDNTINDVEKTFGEYTIKVLTDREIADNPSPSTIAVYGLINGENTGALLKINSYYPTGTKIVVQAYNADGTLAGSSAQTVTNGTSAVNFGSFTAE